MVSKSFASLALALTLVACGGGDDDPDAAGGGGPDAMTNQPDAMGGLPDSMAAGPDAFPIAANAANLGQLCGMMVGACPEGYLCLLAMPGATTGFCSLTCIGDLDATCQNMFPGPGQAMCDFTVTDYVEPFCGIRCGTQWSPPLPTDCPTGLTCRDLTGTMGMPDTLTDFCAP